MSSMKSPRPVIGVLGLGRVGLPLSALLATRGYHVIGYDIDRKKVSSLRSGDPVFYETGLGELLRRAKRSGNLEFTHDDRQIRKMDLPIVTVGTPWDERTSRPDYSQLDAVTMSIGSNLNRRAVILFKSTVTPGTTEDRVIPLVERLSGMKVKRDFGVAFSPERTIEGRAIEDFQTLPKIIGATDERTFRLVSGVLGSLGGTVRKVGNVRTAEMVKMLDNYNRASSIAVINQFALSCEAAAVDVIEVIEAAKFGYPRNSGIMIPGAGVGGSCLNKDPNLLSHFSSSHGVDASLIESLQGANREMPEHAVALAKKVLGRLGVPHPRVVVAGLAFKSGTDDTRYSPGVTIFRGLTKSGCRVVASDPLVKDDAHDLGNAAKIIADIYAAAEKANLLVVATDHHEYRNLDLRRLKREMHPKCGIVDGRHMVDPREAISIGFDYEGVGRPKEAFS